MQSVNVTALLTALPRLPGLAGILGYFGPTVDVITAFSNYTKRTPADVPILIGNNDYEAGLFRLQLASNRIVFPDYFWDGFNLQEFTCPAGLRANASLAANNPTWRYRYFGEFPNTMISPQVGAWHASELQLLFNTLIPTPPLTAKEVVIGNYFRGAWAAFAKDPQEGLVEYGWPIYDPSQDTFVRTAYDNITVPNLINPRRYDADCGLVNVTSTDTSAARPLPDLGASITPTGTAAPTSTASSTGSTTSRPVTVTASTGVSVQVSTWFGLLALVAGFLV